MKFFIVLAVAVAAAVAEPEADPELVYTDGQFHTNYRNLAKGVHLGKAKPFGSLYDVSPIAYKAFAPAAHYPYAAYSAYSAYHPFATKLIKREAEAEAEPFYPLAYTAGISAYPYTTFGSGYTYPYTTYTTGYSAYHPFATKLIKREAEAEAEPFYPLAYTAGISAYPYNTFASGYTYPYTTYNTGYTFPYSAYAGRIIKREAEADSEAFYPYTTYAAGFNGYTYPYTTYSAYSGLYNKAVFPYVNKYFL